MGVCEEILAHYRAVRILSKQKHLFHNHHSLEKIHIIVTKLLSKLIADVALNTIKDQDITSYFGRRIAIDASTSLCLFIAAIRSRADIMVNGNRDARSLLIGFFHRTNRLLELSQHNSEIYLKWTEE